MPRDITISFKDGSQHVYGDVPDDVTPEQAEARANSDFPGKKVKHLNSVVKAPAARAEIPVGPEGTAAPKRTAEQAPGIIGDVLDSASAAAMAVPAGAAVAGGIRGLSRLPSVARELSAFEQTAGPTAKAIYTGAKDIGAGMIPASMRELIAGTGLAGLTGGAAGLAREPIRQGAEAVSEATGVNKKPIEESANILTDLLSAGAGSKAAGMLTGGNLSRAVQSMRGAYGDLGERIAQRGADLRFSLTSQAEGRAAREAEGAASAMREARVEEIAHARSVDEAQRLASEATAAEHRAALGTPATRDDIGQQLRGTIGARANAAYEERTRQAEAMYSAALDEARSAEAAGNVFASSKQGKDVIAELEALKKPGPGPVSPVTEEREKAIDSLIASIRGTPERVQATMPWSDSPVPVSQVTPGRAPAGVEALTEKLRRLRKVDEVTASPVEGFAALDKAFAKRLAGILEGDAEAGTGLYGWNPKYAAADAKYREASRAIDETFGTAHMAPALRGEKFDFRKLAADPAEFGSRFFTSRQSVQQLKQAVGDDAAVKDLARKWASLQLGPEARSADVSKFVRGNADWLREAGIEGDLNRLAANLAKHEDAAARAGAALEQRGKTIKERAESARKDIESVSARTTAERAAIAKTSKALRDTGFDVSMWMRHTPPSEMLKSFEKTILPKLVESRTVSQNEIDDLTRRINEIDKK